MPVDLILYVQRGRSSTHAACERCNRHQSRRQFRHSASGSLPCFNSSELFKFVCIVHRVLGRTCNNWAAKEKLPTSIMDGNKDDAEICLQMAASALSTGNTAKAVRLLEKSRRMYPLPELQNRLEQAIERANPNPIPPSKVSPSSSKPSPKMREEEQPAVREPTAEMLAAVKRIRQLRGKSHYEVLGLDHSCDEVQIKKSYRKLALRLHPDRNFADGAGEAFKRVGQAFMTLSDSKKRAYYDQTGADDPGQLPSQTTMRRRRTARTSRNGSRYHYQEHFNVNEMDADELFEFLFTNSNEGDNIFRAQAQATQRDLSFWERFKPIIILFAVIIMSMVVADNNTGPSYSLYHSSYYNVKRFTRNDVAYFVSRNFDSLSVKKRRRLEEEVDWTAFQSYRRKCVEENKYADALLQRSQGWFVGSEKRRKLQKLYETFQKPWCAKALNLRTLLNRQKRW